MTHYQLIHEEQFQGFDIAVYITPEDISPADCFDPEVDNIPELCEKIADGRLEWFIAKVAASRCGIELASEYLGANLYANALDFVNEPLGYFQDMRHEAVNHARAVIKQLTKGVQ